MPHGPQRGAWVSVVALPALLLAGAGCSDGRTLAYPPAPGAPGTEQPACTGQFGVEVLDDTMPDNGPLGADYLYDAARVHEFQLEVAPEDWAWLRGHVREEQYVPASLVFEGRRYRGAAVRFKGSWTTLQSCLDDAGQPICKKLSLKVSFNEYEPCGRFFGLRKLVFNSSVRDASFLRERLSLSILARAGFPASRVNHARVVVNGEPLGLFVAIENVDKEFLEQRFASAEGNLYKEVWPSFPDAARYEAALQTNESRPDVSRMVALAAALAGTDAERFDGDVAAYVDPIQLARRAALSRVIGDGDGPARFYCYGEECLNGNYFWYDPPGGKMALVPWDLDQTLWNVTSDFDAAFWQQTPRCEPTPVCKHDRIDPCPEGLRSVRVYPAQCDPLWVHSVRNHRDAYDAMLEELAAGPLAPASIAAEHATYRAQIRESVAADPTGPGLEAFETANDWLAGVLERQAEALARRPR